MGIQLPAKVIRKTLDAWATEQTVAGPQLVCPKPPEQSALDRDPHGPL